MNTELDKFLPQLRDRLDIIQEQLPEVVERLRYLQDYVPDVFGGQNV